MARRQDGFERGFRLAATAGFGVLRRQWPALIAGAAGATLAFYALLFLSGLAPFRLVWQIVWLGALASLLAWCLRACLGVLHPEAEGAGVPLERYVWRVGLAWATTVLPAVLIGQGLVALGDPASARHALVVIFAVALALGGFAIGVIASAKVAMTGEWRPWLAWRALRGGRFTAVYSVLLVFLVGMAVVPILALPILTLPEGSRLGWIVGFPGLVLAHAGLVLALAATGLGVLEARETVRPA